MNILLLNKHYNENIHSFHNMLCIKSDKQGKEESDKKEERDEREERKEKEERKGVFSPLGSLQESQETKLSL